jgi:acetate kinase
MLLVVNAGSSSIRLAVFDRDLGTVAEARVAEIGSPGAPGDHATALHAGLGAAGVPAERLSAAAHRVVHGGLALTAPCRITGAVEAQIDALCPLAPLHNPPALAGIRALRALAHDLPQYASFDTAFHASNPDVATRYAIPQAEHDAGIRRYGFHGLSYASLVARLPGLTGRALPRRLLAAHLGNGASLCAILDGVSVATTMGYSPLDGLTMGTRSGAIDGNAVLRLAEMHGVAEAGHILNRRGGLTALGGSNDMRGLHKAAPFAVEHFVYWAVRHAGSMIAALGGLDAVAFTGGIGENDHKVRGMILDGLGFMGAAYDAPANRHHARALHDASSRVAIWTVAAEEERHIAAEALQVMAGEGAT